MPTPINLSPEQPSIAAHNLPELIEAYIVDAYSRVQPKTAASYDYTLGLLLEWWAETAESIDYVLDPRAWRLFERWLASRQSSQSGQPLTYNTRDTVLKRCKQMLNWAYRHNYLDRDYASQVPAAQGNPSKRTVPTLNDLHNLMQAAANGHKPIRDQAILAIFIGTGVRRFEAAALNIEDLTFHADRSGTIEIRKGKGGKARTVVFDSICGDYLLALIDDLPRQTGPLFTGWQDKHLTPESVYKVVKKAMQAVGIDSRGAGPHDLRRAFVTTWTRHRRGVGHVQPLSLQLGHSSPAMTLHYSLQDIDDIHQVFISPLGLVNAKQQKR